MRPVKSRYSRRTLFAVLFAALALLSSCHSARKAQSASAVDYSEIASAASNSTPAEILQHIQQSYGEWQTLYMPVSFDITSPANLSLSGRMTMVRGESVHFSLRVLGMEVAALLVTSDSLIAVDKFHKTYIAESAGSVLGNAHLSVNDVQDALLGRAFLNVAGAEAAPSLLASLALTAVEDDCEIIPAVNPWHGVESAYLLMKSRVPFLAGVAVQQADRQPVMVLYDNVSYTPCGPIATGAKIMAAAAGKRIDIDLNYRADQAKWNEPRNAKITVPASYKRIPASSLIKSLSPQ